MRYVEACVLWLRALFFRARVETEMEKELRIHLEMETENNIRQGMSPADAKRAALIAFGGVENTKEMVRDERRTRWLGDLASDIRFALRGFRMHPLFTVGVVVLTALGVGANAAIFSVINRMLISPLPYPDGNRMVEFSAMAGGGTILITPMQADADKWIARARAVEQIVVYNSADFRLGDQSRGPTDSLSGLEIPPGALAYVGAHPVIGRDIEPADTLIGAAPVVLLSHAVWQTRFAGVSPLGQQIELNGTRHTIVGVTPPGFEIPFEDGHDLFTNFRSTGGQNRVIRAVAKLKPGRTVEDANRELAAIFRSLDKSTSQDAPTVRCALDWVPRAQRRSALLMFGAVFIVLLIACANVANLLMTRAWSRQREFAIRAAMGAARGRLIRQMFTESLMLSLGGGLLGIAVAYGVLKLLVIAQPLNADYITTVRLDPLVVAWGIGLTLGTGLLFGLAPAIFVAGNRAGESLKAGARSAAGNRASRRFRSGLVILEVALSAVLLVASGLLIRTVVEMRSADIGMTPGGLWGIRVSLADKQLGDSIARQGAVRAMLDRVRAVPGVTGASIGMALPPTFAIGMGELEIEGHPVSASDSLKAIAITSIRPDGFGIAGIRLLQGHVFDEDLAPTDIAPGRTGLVVNESFAKRFWPDGGAVGSRVRRGNGPWIPIVGVAADVQLPASKHGVMDRTQFYSAMPAAPSRAMLMVRSTISPLALRPIVEAAIKSANPRIRIGKFETADQAIANSIATHRAMLMLFGAFALLALVLAAFGLHAVIAYSVSHRTREIGVRIALGAESSDVMRLVIGQGFWLAMAGVVVGAIGGVLIARTMRAMLYGVGPGDPVTVTGVAIALATVAVIASYLPARRAASVDPMEALRAD